MVDQHGQNDLHHDYQNPQRVGKIFHFSHFQNHHSSFSLPSSSSSLSISSVTSVCLSPEGDTLYSVSQDSSLKIYSLAERKQVRLLDFALACLLGATYELLYLCFQVRSINVSELALSACALSSDGKSIIIGSWDNNVYVYSIEYGRVLDTLAGHDDAVSSLQLKGTTLVTCSWDSTIKVGFSSFVLDWNE